MNSKSVMDYIHYPQNILTPAARTDFFMKLFQKYHTSNTPQLFQVNNTPNVMQIDAFHLYWSKVSNVKDNRIKVEHNWSILDEPGWPLFRDEQGYWHLYTAEDLNPPYGGGVPKWIEFCKNKLNEKFSCSGTVTIPHTKDMHLSPLHAYSKTTPKIESRFILGDFKCLFNETTKLWEIISVKDVNHSLLSDTLLPNLDEENPIGYVDMSSHDLFT